MTNKYVEIETLTHNEKGIINITIEGNINRLKQTMNQLDKKDPLKHGLSMAIALLYTELEKRHNEEKKKDKKRMKNDGNKNRN
jgi:hypothetical protein